MNTNNLRTPMASGPDDPVIGMDDAGRPVRRNALGSDYVEGLDPDQRTPREKIGDTWNSAVDWIQNDPDIWEAVKGFASGAAEAAWDTMSIPGDLLSGERSDLDVTFGDAFEVAGSAAGATAPMKAPKGAMRIFGGRTSRTHDRGFDEYADDNPKWRAFEMKRDGVDDQTIWEETGWQFVNDTDEQGKKLDSGNWKYEIDPKDVKIELSDEVVKSIPGMEELTDNEQWEAVTKAIFDSWRLSDKGSIEFDLSSIVSIKELQEAYPRLRNTTVRVSQQGRGGSFQIGKDGSPIINLGVDNLNDKEALLDTVTHELQHAVQSIEGWSGGANHLYFANFLPELEPQREKINNLVREQKLLGEKIGKKDLVEAFEEVSKAYNEGWGVEFDDPDIERFFNLDGLIQREQWSLGEQAYKYYMSNPGEIEARAAAARRQLSEGERKESPPTETFREMENYITQPDYEKFRGKEMPVGRMEPESRYAEGGMTMNQPQQPVPAGPGELASDKKDVVDAKLAEGEFVIPAAVVRFYGMDKFHKMISKAQEEMAAMEQSGDIGGDPAPPKPPVDTGDTRAFAEGGVATKSTFDPSQWAGVGASLYSPQEEEVEETTKVVNYVNAQGKILPVTFVNGEPTTTIPPGFYPEGSAPPAQSTPRDPVAPDQSEHDAVPSTMGQGAFQGANPFEMSREEFLQSVEGIKSGLQHMGTAGKVGKGLMALNPVLGGAAMLGVQVAKATAISNMNRAALVAEARGDTTLAESIRADLKPYTSDEGISSSIMSSMTSGERRFEADRSSFLESGGSISSFGEQPSNTSRSSTSNVSGVRSTSRGNDDSEYDQGYNDPVTRSARPEPRPSNTSNYIARDSGYTVTSPQARATVDARPSQSVYESSNYSAPDQKGQRYKKGGLVKRK